MFVHAFRNTFKVLSRQRSMFFWALIFPIILGLFFKLALGHVMVKYQMKPLPIAVRSGLLEEPNFKSFLEAMEKEDYLRVQKADSAEILEVHPDLVAYVAEENQLVVKSSGISQSVVETLLNVYQQKKALIGQVLAKDPTTPLGPLVENQDYIHDLSRSKMDPMQTFFYTLLGMQVLYGYVWGLYVVYQYEANLSTNAKRNLIAPVRKRTGFLASITVAWLFNLVITFVFVLYLKWGLGVDFGGQGWPIFCLILLGAFTGVSFGSLIGVSNRGSIEFKSGLGIVLTMLFSFLAGMMVPNMKVLIQTHAPFLHKINPVSLLTDAVYSLYYYNSLHRFWENMAYLGLLTLLFSAATLFFMRGKQYDRL